MEGGEKGRGGSEVARWRGGGEEAEDKRMYLALKI